jgi:hypothetical protein
MMITLSFRTQVLFYRDLWRSELFGHPDDSHDPLAISAGPTAYRLVRKLSYQHVTMMAIRNPERSS